ncbi:adenosylcobinamide-phosphate synthase CbiB [Chloroflexi bacterium TSY]|nr:adenosylcobinamide-phosphate synthase CbiB [Chloroflexi bacterium TSY]
MDDKVGLTTSIDSQYRAAVLFIALGLDLLFGDPSNRFHPVAWMGQAIGAARKYVPKKRASLQFLYGFAISVIGVIMVSAMGRAWTWSFKRLTQSISHVTKTSQASIWYTILVVVSEAILLKLTFSLRGLTQAGHAVYQPLTHGDIEKARHQLGWHLVGRNTSELSASQVAAATIESLGENTSDGIVAPLVYYSLWGLPGALAYRFLNTMDSMWGYRDAAHEWLGKAPARLDDLVNLVPARLTALAFVVTAPLLRLNGFQAWYIWQRDATQTASPNAGHPMSAMAGALEVELEKVAHYRLGAGQPLPQADDILRASHLVRLTVLLIVSLLAIMTLRSSNS